MGNDAENNKGWSWSSAASLVKDSTYSASKTVGSGAKSAWNSEAVASGASAIKSYSTSAASSIGQSAKSAWNSEAVASGASTVKNYSAAAASSVAQSAKAAWNSEALASGASTVKSYSASAASSVGESAKAASEVVTSTSSAVVGRASSGVWSWWNEKNNNDGMKKIEYDEKTKTENSKWTAVGSAASTVKNYSFSAASSVWNSVPVAATSSAVTNGISSAGNGIKSWWNSEKSEETEETSGDGIRGGIAAMSRNASKYLVQTTTPRSNYLNIFDKTSRSEFGNPKWWITFHQPHSTSNYKYININNAVPGVKNPHIPISPTTAKTVGALGKVAEKANDIAPILTTTAVIFEACLLGVQMNKDYNHGTTRNTIETTATMVGTYTTASLGAGAGGAIGSLIFPGLGTIFGGLIGGVVGGVYGGHYSNVGSKMALDRIQWDVATLECAACKNEYTWKKYQEIKGVCCFPFNSKNQGSSSFWFRKLISNHDF